MKKLLLAAAFAMLTTIATAMAQPYPSRPITIIVPIPACGPVDTLARLLAEPMRVSLGQPLILENVGGAVSTIAAARVARAAPDGYTMIIGNWTSFVGTPAVYPVQFDVIKDFEPVSLLAISQLMVVGRKTLPANNVMELIAWLKANPGKATSGTIGVGSPSQVGGIYFQKLTGTQFQFVPYRGAAPALSDLLSGQIDLRFGAEKLADAALSARRYGQGLRHHGQEPLVPGARYPDHRGSGRTGACAVVLAGVLGAQGNAERRSSQSSMPRWLPPSRTPQCASACTISARIFSPRDQQTPEAPGAYHKAEIEKWWPIIKAAGLKAE